MVSPAKTVDVAVAVIVNACGEVLVSFRHANLHQGNLWEFPGGKIERGESVQTALQREVQEELGLRILQSYPFKTIVHDYPDKSVRLHVRRVTAWTGEALGLEGQRIAWKPIPSLDPVEFPAANAPIVRALQLPVYVAITPQLTTIDKLAALMNDFLDQGVNCIQLRQPQLTRSDYLEWFRLANPICTSRNAILMFNGDPEDFATVDFMKSTAPGFHANSNRLRSLQDRPVPVTTLFSTSCHNLEELSMAARLNADFALLSPVHRTSKYPAGTELGWPTFANLVQQANMPVYALGGLRLTDLEIARQNGASGISGIGMFVRAE